jgi:hypothetical protein
VRRGEEAEEFVVDIGSWSYAGRGHNNDGERWLAVSLAIRRSEWRTLSWEERYEQGDLTDGDRRGSPVGQETGGR